jgi:hypothetical protein
MGQGVTEEEFEMGMPIKLSLKLSCVAAVLIFLLLDSKDVAAKEDIPHQPNVLGQNICFGVEVPANLPEWGHPEIITQRKLGEQSASHLIKLDKENEILIKEELVEQTACNGIPREARLSKKMTAKFCLKSWDPGKYVKISMSSSFDKSKLDGVSQVVYAIGSCKIGSGNYLQYGDIIKVESMHVYRSLSD